MEKHDFVLNYNGKNVTVSREGNRSMLQITYKPIYIERTLDADGNIHWLESAQNRETELAKELGWLLEERGFVQ